MCALLNRDRNVLPECASNLAGLDAKQKTLTDTVGELKQDVKSIIPEMRLILEDHFVACPLYSELKAKQKKDAKQIISGDSALKTFLKSGTLKALLGLIVAVLGIMAALLGCTENCSDPNDGGGSMFRTEAAGSIGRLYVDRDLPTAVGTTDTSAPQNSRQEELCYLIEEYRGAGHCDKTGAQDLIDGQHDLHDVIFLEANITSDAIDEITVSKLSAGTIDIDGTNDHWTQSVTGLLYRYDISTGLYSSISIYGEQLAIEARRSANSTDTAYLSMPSGLVLTQVDDATGGSTVAETQYGPKGIEYTQRFGDSTILAGATYRKEAYAVATASWSTVNTNQHTATVSENLGIPWSSGQAIVSATMQYTTAVGGMNISPVTIYTSDSSGDVFLGSIVVFDPNAPTSTTVTLIVEFDGSVIPD